MTKFNSKTAREAGKRSNRKGVPNKSTKEIREAYQLLVEKNIKKMSTWLNKVAKEDPAKALDIMHKFSDYLLPKLNRTEISDERNDKVFTREEREKRIEELIKKRDKK
ncbi:hypothetical protein SAMN05444483_10990 [Salegentibacter echinorum]|uniref:Uncharacterized protein n=1 Tax=Salegentibacter echinorum TaxID=1073325 RepID=A0A1M5J484_SALEC|nr:hypothetical protein [Salegentibacter echinorum]SHG34823.1 hypothetical protein SAMN05444483_10990 [Salegentibacter echinorum]